MHLLGNLVVEAAIAEETSFYVLRCCVQIFSVYGDFVGDFFADAGFGVAAPGETRDGGVGEVVAYCEIKVGPRQPVGPVSGSDGGTWIGGVDVLEEHKEERRQQHDLVTQTPISRDPKTHVCI